MRARSWLSLAFMGGMRASEWQDLVWENISWRSDADGVFARIFLPTEKSLVTRKTKNIDIVDAPEIKGATYLWRWWSLCSDTVSWFDWIESHGHERVFGTRGGKRLRSEHTRPFFNLYALLNGCDPANVTCHSLRIGAATQLAQKNVCDRLIQAAGRWNSTAYEGYNRPDYPTLRQLRRSKF